MGLNIQKAGVNSWYLDVRVRKAGKEIRRREHFQGAKSQAEERFVQIKQELRFGASAPLRKAKTFGDLLELYQEKKEPFSPKALSQFNQMLRDLGGLDLPSFPERFETYLKIFRATPTHKMKKAPSNGSVNRLVLMVKAVFNLAVRLEVLEKNPLTSARFPKYREVPRDRVLTEYETGRLMNALAVEAPHLAPLVRFAMAVPCRKSELVNMLREDLDLFSNAVRVRNGTTKNDEGCWKPIPPDMASYFRSIPPECPYLFYRIEKGAYRPLGDFRRAWKRCLLLAGIEGFRFHDTRHISASAMVDNGTPEQVVMQVAGWKTPMLKTYYHRAGKNALGLVRFAPGSVRQVDTIEAEAVKVC